MSLLDEKRHLFVAVLDKLRPYNPHIGSYDKSVYSTDFDYSVKLSNGRIRLPEELIDDYEKSPTSISDNRYKAAASRFIADEPLPEAQSAPTGTSQKSKNGVPGLWRILSILIAVALCYYLYQSSQKASARENLHNQVSVGGGNYMVNRILGGIKGLKFTVTNNSDYVMDIVRVKVSYMKADGGLYKEELLYFNHVNAHSTMTLDAPDSDRGVKVDYHLESWTCAALD